MSNRTYKKGHFKVSKFNTTFHQGAAPLVSTFLLVWLLLLWHSIQVETSEAGLAPPR